MEKLAKLLGGGSVISGATPSIFTESVLWADSVYKSFVHVCVCLYVHPLLRYRLNVFFLTFQSPMSKLFRFLESLGKTYGNEVVSD